MSAKANYFKLGMFILLAVVVGIAGVLVLGAARFLEKKTIIETYLDQSAQGIDVGSKVKYRGVSIGSVHRISFTRNHYAPVKTSPNQHSYVLIELELKSTPFGEMVPESVERDLPREVRHGLRAQLAAQGLTGTAYIEIDYLDPTRYPPLPIEWEPAHPYIPSVPSTLSRIFTSVQEVFAELNQINFTNLASAAEMLIARLDQKVGELPVALLSTNAVGLLEEVRDSNRRIQKLLDRPEITATLQDLSGAATGFRHVAELPALTNSVAQLERTLRRLEQLAAGKDHDLEASLDNLRGLTENLRELSENAKRFPAQLLFGEPPKPSKTLP